MKHKPRKRFGQHFLEDANVIQQIIAAINPKTSDHLVEIGPGLGALTRQLLPRVQQLDVVELDRNLIPLLKTACHHLGNLIIHQHDALAFDFAALREDDRLLRIVGNLPYNISTPLLFHLIKQAHAIQDMYFMLQKEVVDRIAAAPGSHTYGRLSIMVQYYCRTDILFTVSRDAFQPPPQVTSSVIHLTPYTTPPYPCQDLPLFENIVRHAFNQRRKTIHNALKLYVDPTLWHALDIDPNLRPEQLSLQNYVCISNLIASKEEKE